MHRSAVVSHRNRANHLRILPVLAMYLVSSCTTYPSKIDGQLEDAERSLTLESSNKQTLNNITLKLALNAESASDHPLAESGQFLLARMNGDEIDNEIGLIVNFRNNQPSHFSLPQGRYQLVALGKTKCQGLYLNVAPEGVASSYYGEIIGNIKESEHNSAYWTKIVLQIIDKKSRTLSNLHDNSSVIKENYSLLEYDLGAQDAQCHSVETSTLTGFGKVAVGTLLVVFVGLAIIGTAGAAAGAMTIKKH